MNIFALSESPVESAIWQHDKHVVKMVLETAQMLSTAVWLTDEWCSKWKNPIDTLYKPAYMNHPCTKWARETLGNFQWLCLHGRALAQEYKHRFKADHKSYTAIIKPLLYSCAYDRFNGSREMTPFAVAMPPKYKVPGDSVQSYRNYYVAEKLANSPKWTNRCRIADLPGWLSEPALHPMSHS
jgi:hypothetical protein